MTHEPPTLAVIREELDAYRQWALDYFAGTSPGTSLLVDQGPSAWIGIPGLGAHIALVVGGWIARRLRLHRLRIWMARCEIRLDHLWYEPVACGLNHAYTRLGLGLLSIGERGEAIECLRRSWRIHPCPHSVSSGLPAALWRALEPMPEAAAARQEYERVARQFQILDSPWPP